MRSLVHYRSWAEPVKFRWAVLITLLWPLQRYTRITMPYHRAWARAERIS
jgi:hypothetical protein